MNFISSKLTARQTKRLGVNSTPGGPLRGVSVSFKNNAVAKNIKPLTTVFQNICKPQKTAITLLQNHPNLFSFCFFFFPGIVGKALGSEICRAQANRGDIREVPSPGEW